MRIVIQRVSHASVTINGVCKSAIKEGFMILVGIENADTQEDADWLCKKIVNLRVFDDENGVMNKSILETDGNILVVSQFTLHASYKKGNRPSYIYAAKPDIAIPLYNYFCEALTKALGIDWDEAFQKLVAEALKQKRMPNGKEVYEAILTRYGYTYHGISNAKGTKRPTVSDMARKHKRLAICRVAHHLVAIEDGYYWDIWDCGNKSLYGYWDKD